MKKVKFTEINICCPHCQHVEGLKVHFDAQCLACKKDFRIEIGELNNPQELIKKQIPKPPKCKGCGNIMIYDREYQGKSLYRCEHCVYQI